MRKGKIEKKRGQEEGRGGGKKVAQSESLSDTAGVNAKADTIIIQTDHNTTIMLNST